MEIIRGLENLKTAHHGAVAVLGFFDGFHRGHQALIRKARALVSRQSARGVLVYTFDRHPLTVVNPSKAPLLLSTLEEKIALAKKFRVDFFLIGRFDSALARLEPSDFLRKIVAGKLRPKGVVAGYNYRFGKNHRGEIRLLLAECAALGLPAAVVKPVVVDATPVSSSRIRKLLERGRVEEAGKLLGRPYALEGKVVRGKSRGAKLGFPTANVNVPLDKLIPKAGVYAGYIHTGRKKHPGLISIGTAPTFGPGGQAVEAYLFNFSGNLYGQTLRLEFLDRERNQKKFVSPAALASAMRQDLSWGRHFFAHTSRPFLSSKFHSA